ncbi:MAG: hypothetical protein AABW54_03940 [Candidatus Micrarchaeota archaeon]
MNNIRTTVVLDAFLAQQVRNAFEGNLSKGLNAIAGAYLDRNDPLKKAYGTHAGWKLDAQKAKDGLRKEWGD